jgi:hypothetical protein
MHKSPPSSQQKKFWPMKTTIKFDLRQILSLIGPSKKIRPVRDKKNFTEEVQKMSKFQILQLFFFAVSG